MIVFMGVFRMGIIILSEMAIGNDEKTGIAFYCASRDWVAF